MNFKDFEAKNIIKYNFNLATACTMKTGGCAKYAFFPTTKEEMAEVILFLKNEKIKYKILGNGSNVIFPDSGYSGAVVLTSGLRELDIFGNSDSDVLKLYVGAGYSLTSLALKMCKLGYSGLEFAYGIPASVGGAVFMNAGAYGGEMGFVIESVDYLDENNNPCTLVNDKDKGYFAYRHSFFTDHPEYVILGATLKLFKDSSINSLEIAEKNMQARRDKQPLEYPSCGSAFKRPAGYFAGALIEQAGLKGKGIGGAYVSEKHAGFVVNKGGATTTDVVNLLEYVKKTVYDNSGVTLEPEINVIED